MSDETAIERRLSAVERAIADGDGEIAALAEAGGRERRLADLEDRLEAIEEAVVDLEAATQALRGYVGNVRSVNVDVERRADAALAAVDRLESRLDHPDGEFHRSAVGRSDERRQSSSADGDDGSNPTETGPTTECGGASGVERATNASPNSGPEMPVPGARTGSKPVDSNGDGESDEGVLDRVRDVL